MAVKIFNEQRNTEVAIRNSQCDLSISEIELILELLGQTTFPVKRIETLYVALYKLQEQHKLLSK